MSSPHIDPQPPPTMSELVIVKRYTGWAMYRDGGLVFNVRDHNTPDQEMLAALSFAVSYRDYSEREFGERWGWNYVPPTLLRLEESWVAYQKEKKQRRLEHLRAEAGRLELELGGE